MIPKSPIDEFFRSNLSNYEAKPSDSLWENIQMARAQKQKPKPAFIPTKIAFSAFLLLTLFASIYFFNHTLPSKSKVVSSEESGILTSIPKVLSKEKSLNTIKKISLSENITNISKNATPVLLNATPVLLDETTEIVPTSFSSLTEHVAEEKEIFEAFSSIPTLDANLPHELSLYSEYLTPTFKKKLWFAKIDLLFSQDFIQNELSAKNASFDDYAVLRNKFEDLTLSNSFKLRMGISTIKGWGLRSGIQYSQMKQEITLQSPDVNTKEILKNKFETIDIPLVITKETSIGKFRLGFSIGTYLNMTFNQTGSFYSPSGTLIEFTSSKPGSYPAFKNRLGASVYTGLSFSYPIGNSLEIIAEPYLRSRIPSISAEDYVLNQKIRLSGIFLGIRKQIGKGFYLP